MRQLARESSGTCQIAPRRYTEASGAVAEVKESPAFAPPSGNDGRIPTQQGGPQSAMIITYAPARKDIGRRLDIDVNGIVIGDTDADYSVEGASRTGSQARIQWRTALAEAGGDWETICVGRVRVNGAMATKCVLSPGDEIRIVDTFFRFLAGDDLVAQWHETIYRLTITDFSTGLHNARYLAYTIDAERLRAQKYGIALVIAVLQLEPSRRGDGIASHDLIAPFAAALRADIPRRWVAARSDEWQLAVIAPDATRESVEHQLGEWLRRCIDDRAKARLGVAAATPELDATQLLGMASANATPLAG